jgi:hypothetical protein
LARLVASAVGSGVVVVPDGGVAEWVAASTVIAQVDQLGEEPVEESLVRIPADQSAVGGVGEQPPPPPPTTGLTQQVRHDPARQRPVPHDLPGRRAIGIGQRVEGDDDPDLDIHVLGRRLPGEPFDQGVGQDLIPAAAAGVTGGDQPVGVAAQRRQTGDALLDRQQPGEHSHGVRRRTQRHPTILPSGAAAGGEPGPVGFVGQLLRGGLGGTQALLVQARFGELLVDQAALFGVEVAGQRHDRLREPLGDAPGREQPPRARQIGAQSAGHPQPTRPLPRGDMRGQRDLVGDPTTQPLRIETPGGDQLGLRLDLRATERDHRGVLRGRHRGPELLEDRDPVDQLRPAIGMRIGRGVGELTEAREQRGQLLADRPTPLVRTHERIVAAPTDI